MPYRSATLRPPDPRPRRARRWAALVAGVALALAGWQVQRLGRQRAWALGAGARRAAAEHAGTLAGGAQVTILRGEGDRAEVIRLPGRLVRRGMDVVREPEVLPARDAVALLPGGECAIDVRGDLFDVSSVEAARARRPCPGGPHPASGPEDVGIPGTLILAEEIAFSKDVGCARERSGAVRCWGPLLRRRGIVRRDLAVPIANVGAVDRLVPVGDRICALQGGTVVCWGGASSNPSRGMGAGLPRPIPMGVGVAELATVDPAGEFSTASLCVRHVGETVRCWSGDLYATTPWEVAHEGVALHSLVGVAPYLCALDDRSRAWCARVEPDEEARFVRARVFDGFERIVHFHGLNFARRGRSLDCDDPAIHGPFVLGGNVDLGVRDDCEEAQRLLPRTTPIPGALLQSVTPSELAASEVGARRQAEFRAALGGGVSAIAAPRSFYRCELGVNGRVACQWSRLEWDESTHPRPVDPREVTTSEEPVRLVPGVDEAIELAVTPDGLACALRSTLRVVCWGRDVGGVLTTAEAARTPSDYPVEALLDRLPSR